ncbi:MAG: sigma-70 family RNA polymerase sigma factor [Pseudomonadota bacterium]
MHSTFMLDQSFEPSEVQSVAMDVTQLARAHGRTVFRAAFRVLNDVGRAEDVQQALFLGLLEKPPSAERWSRIDQPAAYLTVIATRLAIDELRRNRRWRFFGIGEEAGIEDAALQPPQIRERAQQAEHLRRALVRLPRRQAQCFALRVFANSELDQIADQLSMTVNAVSVTLNRATHSLQRLLQTDPQGSQERS